MDDLHGSSQFATAYAKTQTMPFSVNDVLYGLVIPVATTAIVMVILQRFRSTGHSFASLAIVAGFFAGYRLMGLAPWKPATHWQWLPYAMLGAALAGACTSLTRAKWARLPVSLTLAIAAGWVLVPDWESLAPSRTVHLAAFTVYVLLLASLLEPLAARLAGPLLPATTWATMTSAAVVLALAGSLRFAQAASAGSAAMFGVTLVGLWQRETNHIRGASLVFAVMSAGLMLAGRLHSFSDVPVASYVLVPVAPLLLWASVIGPCSNQRGLKRIVVAGAPLAVLGVAVILAALA
jgi:hypothetical protein